jgi:hypothetical protein
MVKQMIKQESVLELLTFPERSHEIPAEDDIYGWLIGSWDLDLAVREEAGGTFRKSEGEVHFAWVLQGKAVQDVWIGPRWTDRDSPWPGGTMFGTTLRMYDRSMRAWRVFWFNGVDGARRELVGRRSGTDIVQEGATPEGMRVRWTFTDIETDSFRWLGERTEADGSTWTLYAEFHGRRHR